MTDQATTDEDLVTVDLTADEAMTVGAAGHVMAQGALNPKEGFTSARRERLRSGRDKLLAAAGVPPTRVERS